MTRIFEIAAALVMWGMIVPDAQAHEFWIEGFLDETASTLSLDLKVGQNLDGLSLPYIPETIESYFWVHGGTGRIISRTGDVPSARVPFDKKTGAVVFHRTVARHLRHNDWRAFREYLSVEGLNGIEDMHVERGLPLEGFTEAYTRHAKLVVAPAGGRTIHDRYLGSPLELVLEQVTRQNGEVHITARLMTPQGPAQNQVTVFHKRQNETERVILRPDEAGWVNLSIGETDSVLLNAVAMRSGTNGVSDWRSDWATLRMLLH